MNILITGATRGLGLALLKEARKRGYYVYATVRDEEGKRLVLQQLAQNESEYVTFFELDVRDEEKLASAAVKLIENKISLDVIINNAAVLLARQTSITSLNLVDLRDSFDINLFGAMMVVKHFLPLLNPHGKILNISSEAGSMTNAYAGDFPYSLSKCAMNLFSEQLSRSLRNEKKEVWSIHPGWIRTDMGGLNAALEVNESAEGIINIADGTQKVSSKQSFINYKGEPMAI